MSKPRQPRRLHATVTKIITCTDCGRALKPGDRCEMRKERPLTSREACERGYRWRYACAACVAAWNAEHARA